MNKVGALSGYRVLDLSDDKGRFCGRLLADMGAEVFLVEKPGEAGTSSDAHFQYLNAGKKRMTLDLDRDTGRELFQKLAAGCDVMIESAPPGHLDSLGLGYSSLSKNNPRLIMASITGFGQTGPYRDFKASDITAAALGGQMYLSGEPGAPPLKLSGEQAYNTACLFAANGILLALWGRHSTGKGQHIDISIMECVAATLDHALVRYFYEGEVARRQGSLYWNNAFRVFPCQDGYVLLTLLHQWETLVEWLAGEGMAADLTGPKWRDRQARLDNISHVIEVLERWTRSHTVAELVEKGQLMRFPWAAVASVPDLLRNPQMNERNFWRNPEGGGKLPRPPVASATDD